MGWMYQLKSVFKDKFCLMSFLLPVVVAFALQFAGALDLSTLSEFHFGVIEDELPMSAVLWLGRYGDVAEYGSEEELVVAVNDPSTNRIGVRADGDGIKTMVSGDEMDLFRETAVTLPALYKNREYEGQVSVTVLERPDPMEGFQNIFAAATLMVAMFMGCTFNAVNMIEEKESGVALVNQILPMTRRQYIVQKIFVGFVFGCLSAVCTACVSFRLSGRGVLYMAVLIFLSAFVASLIGLCIGRYSESLMVGVGYIKIILIVFIAVPLLGYLLKADGAALLACYMVPSSAAFEGIMSLADGTERMLIRDIGILLAHCLVLHMLSMAALKGRRGRG